MFSELWTHRELLRRLVLRNLAVRYQRSTLGFLWALLNPLLAMALLVGVFGFVMRIQVPAYWAFLLSGYFTWVFVIHALGASLTVLPEHASMVKGLQFPTELLVLAQSGSRVLEFCAELVLVVLVLAVFHHRGLPAPVTLLPLLVGLQLLLVVGLALPFASLAVFFRDVQHGLPVALMMLGYLSPVYYPVSLVPEQVRWFYMLNPVARVLDLFHTVLYDGKWPAASDVFVATVMSVGVAALGIAAFRRHRATLPEVI